MPDILRDGRRRGWFHIDNALLDDFGARIGAYGVAVYAALARHADAKGVCFPSYQGIADKLGVSRRQVIRTVAVLVEHGLIRVQTRRLPGKRPQNLYVLTDDWCREGTDAQPTPITGATSAGASPINGDGDAPVTEMHPTGDGGTPRLVTGMHPKKTQGTTPTKQTQPGEAYVPPPPRLATRIPDNFTLTKELYAYAEWKGVSHAEADAMTERFLLYWQSTPGNAHKTDWEKAWKSWLLGDLVTGKMGTAPTSNPQRFPSTHRKKGGKPDASVSPDPTAHGPFAFAVHGRGHLSADEMDGADGDVD